MPPERMARVRLIGLTAAITFCITLALIYGLFKLTTRPPQAPALDPPKAITVTLHPCDQVGITGSGPIEVPAAEFEQVMKLVTPGQYVEGGLNEFICPLIAEVVIRHEGQRETYLLIRDAGNNPAMISADGRHYYYGVPYEGVGDGAMKLAGLVRRLAEKK